MQGLSFCDALEPDVMAMERRESKLTYLPGDDVLATKTSVPVVIWMLQSVHIRERESRKRNVKGKEYLTARLDFMTAASSSNCKPVTFCLVDTHIKAFVKGNPLLPPRTLRSSKSLSLDFSLRKLGSKHILSPLSRTTSLKLLADSQTSVLLGDSQDPRSAGGVNHAFLDLACRRTTVHED